MNKESKEEEKLGNKEVKYSKLLYNFKINNEYGFSESEFTREWTEINEAITELRKEVCFKKNPNIDENDIPEDTTRNEAIIFYFKHMIRQDNKYLRKNDKIDMKILDLFYETWNADNK
jgi:hypothetical protein